METNLNDECISNPIKSTTNLHSGEKKNKWLYVFVSNAYTKYYIAYAGRLQLLWHTIDRAPETKQH